MTTGTIEVPGRPPAGDDDRWVRLFFVGPQFFETLGMPIVAGHGLRVPEMTGRQRVAVVTEAFARFFFGSPQQAIGRLVNRDLMIVGVVADAKYNTFRDAPARALFLPYTQAPPRPVMTLVVRPAPSQRQAVEAVVAAIGRHDPRLKIRVSTLADKVAGAMGLERFAAAIAASLTLLALCLSCAGVVLDCRLRSLRTTERAGRTPRARRLVSRRAARRDQRSCSRGARGNHHRGALRVCPDADDFGPPVRCRPVRCRDNPRLGGHVDPDHGRRCSAACMACLGHRSTRVPESTVALDAPTPSRPDRRFGARIGDLGPGSAIRDRISDSGPGSAIRDRDSR